MHIEILGNNNLSKYACTLLSASKQALDLFYYRIYYTKERRRGISEDRRKKPTDS